MFFTVKVIATGFFETSVPTYHIIRYHIVSEDHPSAHSETSHLSRLLGTNYISFRRTGLPSLG